MVRGFVVFDLYGDGVFLVVICIVCVSIFFGVIEIFDDFVKGGEHSWSAAPPHLSGQERELELGQ